MLLVGAHVSISGGLDKALMRGDEIGCTAIQLFTKNQVQWQARPLFDQDIRKFHQALANSLIHSVVAHNSYLINLGTSEQDLLAKSRQAFIDEMDRAEKLGIALLIFHPGSHKQAGADTGLKLIVESINFVVRQRPNCHIKLLLETTSGQGTSLGYSFEQLKWIIDRVDHPDSIGVCLDTCHIFVAGYDIRTPLAYENTIKKFDQIIGLEKLKAIHLNDSKKGLGSRLDRHEPIGEGQLGLEAFRLIINDSRFIDIPKILEIPGDMKKFKENLDLLKSLVEI